MIGPELVRARRRGDMLALTPLKSADRERALEIATELLLAARAHVDAPHEEVEAALGAVDRSARDEKLWGGLRKLVLDECRFDVPLEVDPVELRRALFSRAAAERLRLEPGEPFERARVLAATAEELGLSPALVEQGLFGDLKGAQQLIEAPKLGPEELLDRYEIAQLQGVLCRAVKLTLTVRESAPDAYRSFFHKLKFRQLLYQVEELEGGGYRIEIDGPFSLFESVTKYGQKLALLVPVLLEVRQVDLLAELRWGKERRPLSFRVQLSGPGSEGSAWSPRSEVSSFIEAVNSDSRIPFRARLADVLLPLAGLGIVVPDVILERDDGWVVYVEVLGFWSREAVWRRVDWARERASRAEGSTPVVFAVSQRLRVSDQVLEAETGACLYVYKGAINARALCALAADADLGSPRR